MAQGFTETGLSNLVSKWEFSPAFGGRIIRDRLWFFTSYRNSGTIQTRAGVFDNLTPQGWRYTPDLNRPAEAEISMVNTNARLTWQATPRNKISVFVDIAPFIVWHRQYTFPLAPEATAYAPYYPNAFKTLTWKSPITNRLLLDTAASHMVVDLNMRRQKPETCRCSAPEVGFGGHLGDRKHDRSNVAGYLRCRTRRPAVFALPSFDLAVCSQPLLHDRLPCGERRLPAASRIRAVFRRAEWSPGLYAAQRHTDHDLPVCQPNRVQYPAFRQNSGSTSRISGRFGA